MNIEVLFQAKQELIEAVEYYELQQEGLGLRFWEEVDRHIDWIARYPETPPPGPGGYRRVNLRVFPYFIPYIVFDRVWILAIAHGHAQPNYFINRFSLR